MSRQPNFPPPLARLSRARYSTRPQLSPLSMDSMLGLLATFYFYADPYLGASQGPFRRPHIEACTVRFPHRLRLSASSDLQLGPCQVKTYNLKDRKESCYAIH